MGYMNPPKRARVRRKNEKKMKNGKKWKKLGTVNPPKHPAKYCEPPQAKILDTPLVMLGLTCILEGICRGNLDSAGDGFRR